MLAPLLYLYKTIEAAEGRFTDRRLKPIAYMDVYRSQPLEPELYEYFPLPSIFVDYSMQGQGRNQPRLVTLTLHTLTDQTPDPSNISEQRDDGLRRYLYQGTLQEVLEGARLGDTSPLIFISEGIVDAPIINYHTQTYQFEAGLKGLTGEDPYKVFGEFETLKLHGRLFNKL